MALVTNIPITSATVDNMSRNEYLLWVNECLQSEFAKLEQMHTGAGYCLFTEILFPGAINLKKVKFNSRLELDWLSNWKLLQTSWKNIGVEKVVPVEKLIKGKFQDNFEFLQWFKKFFDANYDGHEYNPLEMRNFEELPKENKLKPGGLSLRQPQQLQAKTTNASKTVSPSQRAGSGSNMSMNSTGGGGTSTYKKSTAGTISSTVSKKPTAGAMTNSSGRSNVPSAAAQQIQRSTPQQHQQTNVQQQQLAEEMKQMEQQMQDLRSQLSETDDVVGGLEKERDFYFAKLRKIEVLCQDNEAQGMLTVGDVLQILYETEEGFAPPEEVDIGSNGGEYATNGTEPNGQ